MELPEESEAGLAHLDAEMKRFGARLPNELHVVIIRARNLPAVDSLSLLERAKASREGNRVSARHPLIR